MAIWDKDGAGQDYTDGNRKSYHLVVIFAYL